MCEGSQPRVDGFAVDIAAVEFELRFRFRPNRPEPLLTVGDLALAEILPNERGCGHKLAFHFGTIHVVAADLTATWNVD